MAPQRIYNPPKGVGVSRTEFDSPALRLISSLFLEFSRQPCSGSILSNPTAPFLLHSQHLRRTVFHPEEPGFQHAPILQYRRFLAAFPSVCSYGKCTDKSFRNQEKSVEKIHLCPYNSSRSGMFPGTKNPQSRQRLRANNKPANRQNAV